MQMGALTNAVVYCCGPTVMMRAVGKVADAVWGAVPVVAGAADGVWDGDLSVVRDTASAASG